MILEAQLLGEEKGNRTFVDDLQEVLEFTRSLLSAEYKCTPLGEFKVLGFSSQDLREQSHHPEKYFRHGHLLMHHFMGALSLRLNLLRTAARETEIAAVTLLLDTSYLQDTPDSPNTPESTKRCREDIVEALNRLSSLFYILIYKYLPKNYSPVGNAGIN
jgi:ethanolamine utilization cobalamin adenosyltransferase